MIPCSKVRADRLCTVARSGRTPWIDGLRLLDIDLASHLVAVARARGVPERALQEVPGLGAPESEAGGVQAAAAWARQHAADDDAVLPEGLAQAAGLGPAVGVEVALGGAILEAGVGQIERARSIAMANHHDAAGHTQRLPGRVGGVHR